MMGEFLRIRSYESFCIRQTQLLEKHLSKKHLKSMPCLLRLRLSESNVRKKLAVFRLKNGYSDGCSTEMVHI